MLDNIYKHAEILTLETVIFANREYRTIFVVTDGQYVQMSKEENEEV